MRLHRRRSSRIWHPVVLVKTRVWVGCTVSRAQNNSTRRSWCSLFEEWCVIFHNHSAWRVIFLLDFRDWWISFETRSTDINKNRNSWHHFLVLFLVLGGQGWRSQWWEHSPPNNVARVQIPASTPYVGVEFVVGSLPCSERFSLNTPAFPCLKKTTFLNSNSTRNRIDKEPLCGCATSKSLYIFIYYYIYLLLNWSRLDFHRSLGHPLEEPDRGRSAGWTARANSGW